VSEPTSILSDVRGFARDHDISNMPRGFVWDLADYIPDRRGAKLEVRGPWSYFSTPAFAGTVWGGKHAAFRFGTKLLIGAGGNLYDVNIANGTWTNAGAVPTGLVNGVLLRDRVYFADASGAAVPKVITNPAGTAVIGPIHNAAPKGTVLCTYKERLVLAGAPAAAGPPVVDPANVYFSPLETQGTAPNVGPLNAWDVKSVIGTTRAVLGLMPMAAQILVFHDNSIERIRGSKPPATSVDSDMYVDTFSSQVGCSDPASIVPWQENVCFANPLGVFLTDGATIRSLTDQGGISDLWRQAYTLKRAGTQVKATVFRDLLFVTLLTNWGTSTPDEQRPLTLVCDLTDRTWIRFRNVNATAFIDSEIGPEEVWWGVDSSVPSLGANQLSKLSPLLFGPTEYDPELGIPTAPDAIDGNGLPTLGRIRTGWIKLGPEGLKRMRHIYVSHLTQSNPSTKQDVYRIGYRLSPFPHLDSMSLGTLPSNPRYKRNRLRIDRRAYGIQIDVTQVLPVYVSRLYDIAVDQWAQDRTKL
jgi:hypothetical protein